MCGVAAYFSRDSKCASQYFLAAVSSTGTSFPLQYQLANKIPITDEPSGDCQYISAYGDSLYCVSLFYVPTTIYLKSVGLTERIYTAILIPAFFRNCGTLLIMPNE